MRPTAVYRLLNLYPTPSILLFQPDGGDNDIYYRQVISDDRTISQFEPVSDLDPIRVDSYTASDFPPISTGMSAYYAVSTSPQSAIVGSDSTFSGQLHSYIEKHGDRIGPFDLLEFATFLGDEDLIVAAATQCKNHLEKIAPSLVGRWISGAPLTAQVKARLLTQATPTKLKIETLVRIGIAGPYNLMRAMTYFCEVRGGTRAAVLRDLFDPDNVARNMDSILTAADGAISLIEQLQATGTNYSKVKYYVSRGAVKMWASDPMFFHSFRQKFDVEFSKSPRWRDYVTMPGISYGLEQTHFAMLFFYFNAKFSDFEEFVLGIDYEGL